MFLNSIKIMIKKNWFQEKVANEASARWKNEFEVRKLSDLIEFLINVSPIGCETVFPLGKYQLTSQKRVFSNGWHDLWEISIPGEEWHQSWSKPEGTQTINLPPKNVINEVLNEIKNKIS